MITTSSPTSGDSPVDLATDALEAQIPANALATVAAPDSPQTPFPTSLVLTREQEDKMVQFALNYIDQLITDTGREIWASDATPVPNLNTFFGKRELFTMRYYNHVEDRPLRDKDSIWRISNLATSMSQRTVMQMAARANNFFFATDPWYAANFVGVEDRQKSEKVDRHSKWKFAQTGLRPTLEQGVEFAFVRGETVNKTTYKTDDRVFKKKGNALWDLALNKLVTDTKGNPVFEDAAWMPEIAEVPVIAAQPIPGAAPAPVDIAPQVQVAPTGRMVLKKDPATVMPESSEWRAGLWPMKRRIFEGPETKIVYYKDFLCPLSAATIHEAPLIAHLYDLPVMTVIQNFRRQDLADMGASETFESLKRAVDAIRAMTGGNNLPMTAAGQPRGDFKEQGNAAPPDHPFAEIAEVYLTYDADGDGMPEEIMLVIDRNNRFPLFYDYLDNVTPNGRRPFEVVRAKAVDGRWYGMGAMEYFQPEQEFIDLTVNRINFAQGKSGRVTFWNPAATIEGAAQPNLKMNDGGTYRLREGYKKEDALGYVELPISIAEMQWLLTFFMQLIQLKSGIINAGDQKASGMDTGDTATGIRNVEKSGQEMFAQWLSCLEKGIQETLQSNIKLLYTYITQPELFRFFNSQTNQNETDSISPEEVEGLEYDVTILLTRVKSEQVLQSSAESRALIMEFYTLVPPLVQQIVAPFYRDSLKALGCADADQRIVPQPPMMPTAPTMGGSPAGQAANGAQQIADAPDAKGVSVPTGSDSSAAGQPAPLI